MPSLAQARAEISGAAVLPDNRVMDRPAGLAVPDKRRFALVGNADGGNIARRQPGLFNRGACGCGSGGPQIRGLMLDPA